MARLLRRPAEVGGGVRRIRRTGRRGAGAPAVRFIDPQRWASVLVFTRREARRCAQ